MFVFQSKLSESRRRGPWKRIKATPCRIGRNPGSTTVARPINSLQIRPDKMSTRVTNTIKLPTQGTSIRPWNVRILCCFQRKSGHANTRTPRNHCQFIRLDQIDCFCPQIPSEDWSNRKTDDNDDDIMQSYFSFECP